MPFDLIALPCFGVLTCWRAGVVDLLVADFSLTRLQRFKSYRQIVVSALRARRGPVVLVSCYQRRLRIVWSEIFFDKVVSELVLSFAFGETGDRFNKFLQFEESANECVPKRLDVSQALSMQN